MNKIIFIFLCLGTTFNLYSLDISALEIEYVELLEDIKAYGPDPTIPYYTNYQYYNNTDKYTVDVDNDFVFAILGSGFLKFVDTQGNVRYSRYLWLNKHPEGYFIGLPGRCADEFYEVTREGYDYETQKKGCYWVTAYLPLPSTKIKRKYMTIEMDEVIPVERMVVPREQNTSMINLVYTVNRMIEIAYILKQMQTEVSYNFEFKIRTLEIILDLVIKDRYEIEREYRSKRLNNQPITQVDFYGMHPHLKLIDEMLPFLELDR